MLRKLYENTKQKALNSYIKDYFASIESINPITNMEKYITNFTQIIPKDIELLIPIAKISLYNKR